MRDTAITHEGKLPNVPGWQVCLSDGATFTAHPPSGQGGDSRWTVNLRPHPAADSETFVAHAHTLVAAVSHACKLAEYEGRTGHVLATLTVHLVP